MSLSMLPPLSLCVSVAQLPGVFAGKASGAGGPARQSGTNRINREWTPMDANISTSKAKAPVCDQPY